MHILVCKIFIMILSLLISLQYLYLLENQQ